MRTLLLLGSTILPVSPSFAVLAQAPAARPHNVVPFVADGLRFRIVDDHRSLDLAGSRARGRAAQQPCAVSDLHHRKRL